MNKKGIEHFVADKVKSFIGSIDDIFEEIKIYVNQKSIYKDSELPYNIKSGLISLKENTKFTNEEKRELTDILVQGSSRDRIKKVKNYIHANSIYEPFAVLPSGIKYHTTQFIPKKETEIKDAKTAFAIVKESVTQMNYYYPIKDNKFLKKKY